MSGSHLIPETEEELKQEVEQAVDEMMSVDEIKASAGTLQILFQSFRKLGYKLADRKKKAPIRVLEALLFDGLEDVELTGKEEENLLDISRQIMHHKEILLMAAIQIKQQKEEEKNER